MWFCHGTCSVSVSHAILTVLSFVFSPTKNNKQNLAPWKTISFTVHLPLSFFCLSICPSTHSRAPRLASSPVTAPINLPKHMNKPISFVYRICQMQLTIPVSGTQSKGNSGTTHTKQLKRFRACGMLPLEENGTCFYCR